MEPAIQHSTGPNAPRRGAGPAWLTILGGIAGIALVSWGFVGGIGAALDGSGNGAGAFVAIFFLGALLVLCTIVAAVLGLTGPGHRVLWSIALALGLLPVVAVIVVAINARG